ncbi:MAG: thiamine pyrophosphate-binding protein [Gammaproteobacteria bacterium]|jgi:thiamine pyrophosphate-dependent acetolactate synthase large subunit-like protein
MTSKRSGKPDEAAINRRQFMAGAGAAGAALGSVAETNAQAVQTADGAVPPSESQRLRDQGAPSDYSPQERDRYFVEHAGSDFMVDVIKSLDIDYLATNPGSSFRGLHESLVNYGGNHKPEVLTCVHEEQAVAMGHGYFKVAGKPLAVACHGTVGIQHAAMAVYNAWCDRAPVVLIAGNHLDATDRRIGVEWAHSAQDCNRPIRDYIKWDDTPVSLPHFAESMVRAYKIAMTAPAGPVAIVADGHLQEAETANAHLTIPAASMTVPPRGDANAIDEAARALVSAEAPVIVVDRYAHDQAGVALLVELAEALQAPVVDRRGRMNFPNTHYLYQGGNLMASADVILGLELNDTWGVINALLDRVHREAQRTARDDVTLITIGTGELFLKSNYQNFQRYQGADLSIAGDAQATLPSLIEAVSRAMTRARRTSLAERERRWRTEHAARRERALDAARYGWDASPVSTARLAMEVWDAVRDRDWGLVSDNFFTWPHDFWQIERHYQHIGSSGGAGVGYGAPAAVGAALAHRDAGRLAVNFQADGDMMYVPGVFWTAAHHHIPLLSVMHNNRAYHQEVMHLQRMTARRRRGVDGSARIGNVLEDPTIDFASMVRSMGVWAEGPVEDPRRLGPLIREALAVIDQGEPAFIDVVAQPR